MAAGVNLKGGGHQPVSLPSHVPRWAKVTNIMRLIVPPELIIRLLRKIRRGPCGVVATSGRGGGRAWMARGPGAGPVTAGKLRLELWCVELLGGPIQLIPSQRGLIPSQI